jgi:hypothetical protein
MLPLINVYHELQLVHVCKPETLVNRNVLYKICSVLCVLEQPTVDNSNEGSHKRVAQLGANGSIRLRPVLFKSISELNAVMIQCCSL